MSIYLLMAAAGQEGAAQGSSTMMFIPLIVMMGLMFFFQMRSSKKRQNEEQAMRDNLEIGDEIVTIGGIVGRVVTVREEDIIIETGADRTKLRILKGAISSNKTKADQHKKEVEAAKLAAKEKKEKKKADKDAE